MLTITERQELKRTILVLAKQHKENCKYSECDIALYPLRKLIEDEEYGLNMDLTSEEKGVLI